MFTKKFTEQQAINKARLEKMEAIKKQEKATYEASLELLLNNQESLQAVKNDILRGLK